MMQGLSEEKRLSILGSFRCIPGISTTRSFFDLSPSQMRKDGAFMGEDTRGKGGVEVATISN